jgi:hypothetical protein
VAGRGGTAAAEKADESSTVGSSSPSSCNEESGGGSMDGAGAAVAKVAAGGAREKKPRDSEGNTTARRATKGNIRAQRPERRTADSEARNAFSTEEAVLCLSFCWVHKSCS